MQTNSYNLHCFPDVPLGVAMVTHGPVAALVVPDPDLEEPGQEESQ